MEPNSTAVSVRNNEFHLLKVYAIAIIVALGIFEKCPSLPESYVAAVTQLNNKYMPIEYNPAVPHEEKKKHMEEWWRLSEQTVMYDLKLSRRKYPNKEVSFLEA